MFELSFKKRIKSKEALRRPPEFFEVEDVDSKTEVKFPHNGFLTFSLITRYKRKSQKPIMRELYLGFGVNILNFKKFGRSPQSFF